MMSDGVQVSMAPKATACKVVMDSSVPCLLMANSRHTKFVPRTEHALSY